MDMKGHPRKGDRILFIGSKTSRSFTGVSGASGKFSIQLPGGDIYNIIVKNLGDSVKRATLEIPALRPDEYYSDAFSINIRYEPARSFTLDNVHFDFGKATLRTESFAELNELVDFLIARLEDKIEIAGHTDNVGKDADNLRLSQARADAIRAYLIKKGISSARIIAKGYGATRPIADNESEEGRQLNRRTEVWIL